MEGVDAGGRSFSAVGMLVERQRGCFGGDGGGGGSVLATEGGGGGGSGGHVRGGVLGAGERSEWWLCKRSLSCVSRRVVRWMGGVKE